MTTPTPNTNTSSISKKQWTGLGGLATLKFFFFLHATGAIRRVENKIARYEKSVLFDRHLADLACIIHAGIPKRRVSGRCGFRQIDGWATRRDGEQPNRQRRVDEQILQALPKRFESEFFDPVAALALDKLVVGSIGPQLGIPLTIALNLFAHAFIG